METKIMLPLRHIAAIGLLAAVIAALQTAPTEAAFGIVSVSGATELLGPPPPNLFEGSVEQAIDGSYFGLPIVFHEKLGGYVFPTNDYPNGLLGMGVDHNGTPVDVSPVVDGTVVNSLLQPGLLPVGTHFNSYLVHFDPVDLANGGVDPFYAQYISEVSFDRPIIGVQIFSKYFQPLSHNALPYRGKLEDGDLQVWLNGGSGPPPTYYPDPADYRGLEEDSFSLVIVGNTIKIGGTANGPEIDEVRIFTAAVPEPATAVTWAVVLALGCSGAFVWRRFQTNI
jgi:hypothetical protein